MTFWLESVKRCPKDGSQLNKRNQYAHPNCEESIRIEIYDCPLCRRTYLKYHGAEIAAKTGTSTIYLSATERDKVRKKKEEKTFQDQRIERAEKTERKKLEDQKKAELAKRQEKKEKLILHINSVFQSDFLASERCFNEINSDLLLSESEFQQLRDRFVYDWFLHNPKSSGITPDRDQCSAIGATRKNVEIVARAGSGKTATIVNRFRFLTEHCHIAPDAILILAFNKKAVLELRQKIEKLLVTQQSRSTAMPHILTFHALAHSIVHPEEKLIYDDDKTGSEELSRTIQAIIDTRLRDIEWSLRIKKVMLAHFRQDWETIELDGHNLTKEEQLLYRRSIPNRTLKGEYVKSFGEKVIADFLFEYDIEYQYEKAFYWYDRTIYRPDFTVGSNTHPVVIEYFGLIGDPEYNRQIQQKRGFWINKGVKLIEVVPAEISENYDELTSIILGALTEEGIVYRKLSDNEIWERIRERAIDDFTGAITTFVGRCRKLSLSPKALRELVLNESSDTTVSQFHEIALSIYDEYLETIQRERLEDFDGLINRAAACVQDGKTGFDKGENRGDLKNLSFIMIDEYQDFSYLFDAFLESIRDVCPEASLFCVGDDWQAINAFAGSDVKYFNNFTQRYTDSSRFYLKTNYRSKKEIVSVGNNLMSQGKAGYSIRAVKTGQGTVRVGYLSDFSPTIEEQSIHHFDRLTPAVLRLVASILKQGKRVIFLVRTNKRLPETFTSRVRTNGNKQDVFLASIQSFFPRDERSMITASTTHKYKGKEEDAVIILDGMNSFYPLINPSWVFQSIFGDTLDKLVEEEQRLFYVAVSRAKDDLFILTSKGEESPFLSKLGKLTRVNWAEYEPFGINDAGILIEVRNQNTYDSRPTIAIKERLKENQYKWEPKKKVWYRFYPRDGFDISTVLSQTWTQAADHVELIQYNENGQMEKVYLFIAGQSANALTETGL